MRIFYAVPRYLPSLGGIEVHVSALASEMVRLGHVVSVATLGDRADERTTDGITVRTWRGRLPLLGQHGVSGAYLRDVAREARGWDLVHVHNIHAVSTLGVLACLPPSVPTVLTPHFLGTGAELGTRALHAAYAPLVRRAVRQTDTVICVSETEAADATSHLRIARRDAVQVVPNGVPDAYATGARTVSNEEPLVLTASRLEAYKQPQVVVESLPFLPHDWTVAAVGAGPLAGRLRSIAVSAGCGDRLVLPGRVPPDEMQRWYARAGVYVTMSRRECFGLTIAEALAAGVPVVASDIPVHREVFGLCGWDPRLLVPVDASAEMVAAAVVTASAMQPDRHRPPTWSEVGRRTEAVYDHVLADAIS